MNYTRKADFPVEFFSWEERLRVQCMRIAPYSNEPRQNKYALDHRIIDRSGIRTL